MKTITTIRILMAYRYYTPAKLLVFANTVISSVADNAATFPNPTPSLAEMDELLNQLRTALAEAALGGSVAKNSRNTLSNKMKDALSQLSFYVTQVCNNDLVKLGKSGFETSRKGQTIGPLPAPELLRAQATGIQGQIKLKWKAMYGARAYEIKYRVVGTEEWQPLALVSKANAIADNMIPRVDVSFSIRAIGRAGMSPSSQITAFAA